jgi:tryptophan synthase alpha chain
VLEQTIRALRQKQDILLMTHIVAGYPSFDDGLRVVEAMVEAGVELIEMQIPFSEPIADGPVILHANQKALQSGATVARCLEFGARIAERFPVTLLVMSYYNILYKYGVADFVARLGQMGYRGAIVPDLPPEEGAEYLDTMQRQGLSPIFIYSPRSSDERLRFIAEHARGFVYCVARKGVTGQATTFSESLGDYLVRCRRATSLPLAVGFGVRDREDVDFLRGKADIAVIGTETLRRIEQSGVASVEPFLKALR